MPSNLTLRFGNIVLSSDVQEVRTITTEELRSMKISLTLPVVPNRYSLFICDTHNELTHRWRIRCMLTNFSSSIFTAEPTIKMLRKREAGRTFLVLVFEHQNHVFTMHATDEQRYNELFACAARIVCKIVFRCQD